MIKCKICGITRKCSLVQHIKKEHPEITIEEYKNKYGNIMSNEHIKSISEKQKKNWESTDYRNNISIKLK